MDLPSTLALLLTSVVGTADAVAGKASGPEVPVTIPSSKSRVGIDDVADGPAVATPRGLRANRSAWRAAGRPVAKDDTARTAAAAAVVRWRCALWLTRGARSALPPVLPLELLAVGMVKASPLGMLPWRSGGPSSLTGMWLAPEVATAAGSDGGAEATS